MLEFIQNNPCVIAGISIGIVLLYFLFRKRRRSSDGLSKKRPGIILWIILAIGAYLMYNEFIVNT